MPLLLSASFESMIFAMSFVQLRCVALVMGAGFGLSSFDGRDVVVELTRYNS